MVHNIYRAYEKEARTHIRNYGREYAMFIWKELNLFSGWTNSVV
jgi:hypothetical protein